MSKRPMTRFVQFILCLSFALSLLGCAASLETIPSSFLPSTVLPSAAVVAAQKAQLAIPAKLRAELKEILAQPCKVAENDRPNPRYVGQIQQDPLWELEKRLLLPVLQWAVGQATEPTPEERVAHPRTLQILP